MMWAVVSNRREKLDLIIEKAARKTFGGNDADLGDDEQKVEHFEPLKYYIQAAVMARKSMELCDEVVLSGVKKLYNQMADHYEEKSVNLITEIGRDAEFRNILPLLASLRLATFLFAFLNSEDKRRVRPNRHPAANAKSLEPLDLGFSLFRKLAESDGD